MCISSPVLDVPASPHTLAAQPVSCAQGKNQRRSGHCHPGVEGQGGADGVSAAFLWVQMFICRKVEGSLHQQAFGFNTVLPPAEVVLPPKSRTALRLESEEAKRAAERAERERRCQLALSEIKRKQQLARERAARQVHA